MHSHLLPGVDDGVTSPEETLACLHQLAAWGIQRVITTPHVSQDWYPNTQDALLKGQVMLQALVNEHQIPLTIDVAAEYLLDDLFLNLLRADQLSSFGQQKYVLFETGWAAAPVFLNEIIFHLRAQGYQPLLAHPERYTYYHNDLKPLAELRKAGCLFQLNWGSMTGRYGRRVQAQAHKFLTNTWVDFMGSDIHRPTDLNLFDQLVSSADYHLLKQQPLRNQELLLKK
ncbi:histidinol-phosphatase [Spirosoma sp. HMF3257]|uniref:protein-tyrosine-phosphatase n=1 Tax=Spirosoma telluris TaxID=2183553 RepID=A0A327NSI4_9BACT|nr:histidinol-phosphatase [Spirosoma telluris]RAI78351.1 histidinol-phosphatase [Spirosoma telluris]